MNVVTNGYAHVIGWAKGSNSFGTGSVGGTLNGTAGSATFNNFGTTLTRLTYDVKNNTAGTVTFTPRVNARTSTASNATQVYFDDVIMYTDNTATADVVKPVIPTSFTNGTIGSSSVTFTWTNGSDAGTGIQNTIILRTTNTAASAPVLNDQGVYSTAGGATGPNIVSTDWTVISTSVTAAAVTYTDNSVAAGTAYKYAVVHRDLAYNYSTALMSGTITTTSPIPTITTTVTASTITSTTASSGGQTLADGGSGITSKGVVYAKTATTTTPTIALNNGYTSDGTGTGNFTSTLGSGTANATVLDPQSQYYYRAYAINANGTGYGPTLNFRTLSAPPTAPAGTFTATETSSSNIDLSWTAATFPGAGATATGYLILRSSGVTGPTIAATNGIAPSAQTAYWNSTTGTSISNSGLSANTQYNYAVIPYTWDGTNPETYNYYLTGAPSASATTYHAVPTLSGTTAITAITDNSASSGGTGITGSAITAKGVVWNEGGSPSINDYLTNDGTGTGNFSSTLTGLLAQNLYYVSSYATNNGGTGYGPELSFYTLSTPHTSGAGSFAAAATVPNQLDLSWTAATEPVTGAHNAAGYIILRREDGSAPTATGVTNATAAGSLSLPAGTTLVATIMGNATVSYNDGSLQANKRYDYAIIPFTSNAINSATIHYYTAGITTAFQSTQAGAATISTTTALSAITDVSAASGGSGLNDGGNAITDKGLAWNTSPAPTTANFSVSAGSGSSDFTASLTSLAPQTQYFVRAYATNNNGTAYANELSFYTLAAAPTAQAGTFSASATAGVSGSVTLSWTAATFAGGSTGGYLLVYGTGTPALVASPDGLSTSAAVSVGTGVALGAVTGTTISGLTPGTTYNFLLVPYSSDGSHSATNNYLDASAPTTSFVPVGTPSVTTTTVTGITASGASSGGTGIAAASGSISAKGVVWATGIPTPTLANFSSNDGTGTGDYTSTLSGLSPQTQYVYRAYVTNEAGTGYGSTFSFYTWSNAPASAVSNLVVSSVASAQIALSWTGVALPSGATEIRYLVLRATGASAPSTAGITNGSAPSSQPGYVGETASASFTNTGLAASTQYTYVVIPYTFNGTGNGTYNYYTTGAPSVSGTTTAAPTANDYFRSAVTSGNWGISGNWEISASASGPWEATLLVPTSASKGVQIKSTDNITVAANLSIDDVTVDGTLTVSAVLTIANGTASPDLTVNGTLNNTSAGTLTMAAGATVSIAGSYSNSGAVNGGAGSVMTVTGSLTTPVTTTGLWGGMTSTNLVFAIGSNYYHNTSGGVFPPATWQDGSNATVNPASVAAIPTGVSGQSFYNFTWSPVAQTSNLNFTGSLRTVRGNLTVSNTGSGSIRLTGGTDIAVNIDGNLELTNSTIVLSAGTGLVTMTVKGNIILNNGGIIDWSNGSSAVSVINAQGDVTMNTGSQMKVTSSGDDMAFNFTKTTGVQTFTQNGTFPSASGTILTFGIGNGSTTNTVQMLSNVAFANTSANVTIANGATLEFGTFTMTGANSTFTLASGGKANTANALGLPASVAVSGTKTYSSLGKYTFSGTGNTGTFTTTPTGSTVATLEIAGTVTNNYGTLTTTDLTLTSGSIDQGSNTLNIKGNINRNGSTQTGTVTASSATIVFNGTSGQTVAAGSFNGSLGALTINNSAGVTLNQSLTVTGAVTLTSGKLDIAGNTLTVNAASLGAGTSSNYIKTSGAAGGVQVLNILTAGKTVPVGNSTYNPVTIAGAAAQNWLVRVDDGITNVSPSLAANTAKAVNRMWQLTPSLGSPLAQAATLTFQYSDATDVGASFNNNMAVKVWHYNGVKWMGVSPTTTPGGTPGSTRTVSAPGLTEFSPFAISNIDAPLPVSLLSFMGKRNGSVNELKWKTASESNNRGFAIERSADGASFTQVGFVTSRANGGNSTSDISYAYNDASTGTAGQSAITKWYYRLKQVDMDGQYKYSAVVLLKGDKSGAITVEGIYPNPVKASASIRLQASGKGGSVVLQLTDMLGKVVRTQSVNTEAGAATTVSMDMSGMAAGQYHLKAVAGEEVSETVTVIKN